MILSTVTLKNTQSDNLRTASKSFVVISDFCQCVTEILAFLGRYAA